MFGCFFFIVSKILSIYSIDMEFSLYLVTFICGFSFVSVLRMAFSLKFGGGWEKKAFVFSFKLQDKNKVRHCLPSTGERYKFVYFVVNHSSRLSIL